VVVADVSDSYLSVPRALPFFVVLFGIEWYEVDVKTVIALAHRTT